MSVRPVVVRVSLRPTEDGEKTDDDERTENASDVSRRSVLRTTGAAAGASALGVGASGLATRTVAARKSTAEEQDFEPSPDPDRPVTPGDGGLAFDRNRHLINPFPTVEGDTQDDVEPQIVSDAEGVLFAGGIRGLSDGGSDVWRSFDCGQSWEYVGQPDGFPGGQETDGLGGGDIAMAVGEPYEGTPGGNLYVASLYLGDLFFSTSTDRGETWTTQNPFSSAGFKGVDRQWIDAFGESTVYMSFHDVETFEIQVVKTTDAGTTFVNKTPATLGNTQSFVRAYLGNDIGNIRTDREDGTVYQLWGDTNDGSESSAGDTMYMSVSTDGADSWTVNKVHTDPNGRSIGHLFPVQDIDSDGNLYVSWSDNSNIYYSFSTDKGTTWSDRIQVNSGPETNTSIFPWVAAEDGVANFTWYASPAEDNQVEGSEWRVYFAQVENALGDGEPKISQVEASDHVVHVGPVCQGGTGCSGGRELVDVFYMTLDQQGLAHIAYTDDRPDDDIDTQQTYVASQVAGPSAGGLNVDVTGDGQPATDVDCDGRFENVNGDVQADVVDVQALFANRGDASVQNNAGAFDFSNGAAGDGEVNVVDVQALFVENT
jgi:hypothetical protein